MLTFSQGERKDLLGLPAAVSDVGLERDLNEDRYCVLETQHGVFWAVFDGLGGVQGGEVAAQIAMDVILREISESEEDDPENLLTAAIKEANRIILLRRQNPNFSSMGTTVVAALISKDRLCLANVGDSRAYIVSQNDIKLVTIDHTYVQELVDQGKLKAEEALAHPESHILTRCLGSNIKLEPDLFSFRLYQNSGNDILVLCTDGLYSLVNEMEIAQVVKSMSPQSAALKLVEIAKARGGFDNITVAVIPLAGRVSFDDSISRVYKEPRWNWRSLALYIGLGFLAFFLFFSIFVATIWFLSN